MFFRSIHPELLNTIQLSVTLVVLVILVRSGGFRLSREAVVRWGMAWVMAASAAWWFAGPYSFSAVANELDFALPIHQFYAQLPAGTKFAHGFGGGMDAYALNQFAGQYVYLERILIVLFPVWLAVAIHKVLVFAGAFIGSYLLCRRLAKGSREISFAAAAVFSMASDYASVESFWHGQGLSLLPLGVYLLVVRCGRAHYFKGAILFGLYYAITGTVPVTLLSLLAAVPLAALVVCPARLFRVMAALGIVVFLTCLNASETITALFMLSPYVGRSKFFQEMEASRFLDLLKMFAELSYFGSPAVLASSLAAVGFILFSGRAKASPLSIRATMAYALFAFIIAGLQSVPWSEFGLGVVGSMGFNYATFGVAPLALLVVSAAAARRQPVSVQIGNRSVSGDGRKSSFFASLVLALAVGQLAYYAGLLFLITMASGGIRAYAVDDLRHRPWQPRDPYRVVGIPHRLPENMLAAAGMDAMGAITSYQLRITQPFWAAVVGRDPETVSSIPAGGSLYPSINESNAKCCDVYDIDRFKIDLDLLGLANVRYIISRLPLAGGGLTKVAGPPDNALLPRDSTPYRQRIIPYLKWIINPPPVFVYELPTHLPRVFAASAIRGVADDISSKEFLRLVLAGAPGGTVVARKTGVPQCATGPLQKVSIAESKVVLNGFHVALESGQNPGLVVLNVPFTPFWRVRADGQNVPIFSVNDIHMATCVPSGTKSLDVSYVRPLLREMIARALVRQGGE